MKSEKGQALPLVMIAVVIGALVIPPFLGHAGSSLIGSRVYAQAIHSQYAGDSGAEHAIWNLTNGGLTANLTSGGDSVSYSLDELINGLGANVTVSWGWETLAWDDFESGGWTGGSGWLDNWNASGDAAVIDYSGPYEGSWHLQLRDDNGYVERSVDLSHEVSARLQFWAQANSFESGDSASCLISSNGIDWTEVDAWASGDADVDNQYHHYDIDLTPYDLTSQFWIAFEANMSSTHDYFYVDKLEIIWQFAAYGTIASDDFESGNWTGGSGWLDDWNASGDAAVTGEGVPYGGSYHLRLRSSDGYAERSVDLSNEASSHLQFWAKADSIDPGEEAHCLVSDDGIDWDIVATWDRWNDDNIYHYYDIDLTPYNLTSQFWIAFEANMGNQWDFLYVDNIVITGARGYGITSLAGDNAVKAVVEIDGGTVTVLSWYIV